MSAHETLDELATLGREQRVLRASIVVAPLVTLGATEAAGRLAGLVVPIVVLLSLVTAARPDSSCALVVIGTLVWQWYAGVGDVRTPWTLVAAVSIAVVHTVTAAATIAPAAARLTREMQVRWFGRTCVIAGVAVAVWAAVDVLTGVGTSGNVLLASAGVVAAAGLVAVMWPRPTS